MRPLTRPMADALLKAPAFAEGLRRRPLSVDVGTSVALEARGLVEVRVDLSWRRSSTSWRRTVEGDRVAEQVASRKAVSGGVPSSPPDTFRCVPDESAGIAERLA